MTPDSEGSHDQAARKPPEQQLNRACEACRLSKVRCLPNRVPGNQTCQRCAKAGKTCIFAPPVKRRQRKRTDVRVAELEREIKAMRSLLKPNQTSPAEASEPESMDEDQDEPEQPPPNYDSLGLAKKTEAPPEHSSRSRAYDWPPDRSREEYGPVDPLGPADDIIDRGIISQALADELLNIYRNDLTQQCPGVLISRDWTALQLREKKPALFHAVMAAASHSKGAELSNKLHDEVILLFARSLFIRGEKSVQHIQALLVTVTFFTPPSTPAKLQIYQYSSMAACMALELGLASKPRTHEQLPKRAIKALQRISSAEELLENCRTILFLYVMTAGFAMRLRRPNTLLFNSWMEECLGLLQKSTLLEDKRVVAWLKLQRIADEAYTAFGFDDASTSFSLSELRLQVILRIFERRMQEWKKSIPPEVMTLSLMIEHYGNMISMYEFAMDGGQYDAPDFRNRHLTLPALDDDCVQPETLLSRSALQVNATVKCISVAHSLLDCFAEYSLERMRKSPNVLFVRAIYALLALLKADYAVTTDADGMGEVLDSESLKVDFYMSMVLQRTADAIGPQRCRVPSHWLFILNHKLVTWYEEYQQWRKDGKHLKRNSDKGQKDEIAQREPVLHPTSTTYSVPAQPSSTEPSTSSTQTPSSLPNFSMTDSYASWPTPAMDLPEADAVSGIPGQPSFATDIGDFTSAFQNGDLYLWNDVNETFGGWIPQANENYSMQFGAMGGQGF
ncbi:hypothetical protein BU24DRAFT_371826 [Aaosphaeria arxii CBS 175.79]|uniref:Zn(2)-C6 fungal-type domain-containing protein n=1 Tax=Aaosphaeria arxii CBS 175.79 TaxID=1450172 RepID=A0A6A5XQ52_9PLEO|nr:uncharacterized protein BU24DRAFT_371826 [Aaosphaeria arxii CBS 175.79]KAF2014967.1 hypothetical protein BU24DRAFT_371826 [Aaosphaeria arxii CBS 175.79]